jgi:hypothetical protein
MSQYVPRSIAAFIIWAKTIIAYATRHHERWNVGAPPQLTETLVYLEELANKCATNEHTQLDVVNKKETWKYLEKEFRNYLQGMVMRNVHVTAEDRAAMNLPPRDTVRTPIGEPVGQAEADISYPGRTQLMLHIRHVQGTPTDARTNYGFRIYYGVFPTGQPLPAGETLLESRFTRIKKELFTFNPSDSGKTAVFCIRYENSKGKVGPWGPVMNAIIP